MIDAVARALRLDEVEARYFRSLLQPAGDPAPAAKARPALLSMIGAMDVPAVIHGPHLEVLGLNRVAAVLFDGLGDERNYARWLFLDARARVVYRDWADVAADVVALLRAAPAGDALTRVVGDLHAGSDEFARMWADYRLSEHRHGVKRLFHAAVGELRLNWQTLRLPDSHGQSVVVYSADTGSPSEEKLRLLTSWTAAAGQAVQKIVQSPRSAVSAKNAASNG